MDWETYKKDIENINDFDRAFKPWNKWQYVKLSEISPCKDCKIQKEYIDRRYEFMMNGADAELYEENCKHCVKRYDWIMDCINKLRWYESNDLRLK